MVSVIRAMVYQNRHPTGDFCFLFTSLFNHFSMTQQELLVEEIHTAIDTAGDRIIEQANKILANASTGPNKIEPSLALKEKAARLVALGFTKAAEVRQLDTIRQQNQLLQQEFEIEKRRNMIARADGQNAQYYKLRYPFSKFLTMREMDSICEKYGLIYAPVSAYMREVPAKNLLEIEQAQGLFALDAPDDFFKEGEDKVIAYSGTGKPNRVELAPRIPVSDVIKLLKVEPGYIQELKLSSLIDRLREAPISKKVLYKRESSDIVDAMAASMYAAVMGGSAGANEYHALMEGIIYTDQGVRGHKRQLIDDRVKAAITCPDRPELFIAAPADHFDTSSLVATGQFEMGFPLPVVDEDPIVFRKVRGGILVDSKWGLEASDPLLLNPINN